MLEHIPEYSHNNFLILYNCYVLIDIYFWIKCSHIICIYKNKRIRNLKLWEHFPEINQLIIIII